MRVRRLAIVLIGVCCLVAARGLLAQQPPAAPAEDAAALQKRIAALVAQLGGQDMKGQIVGRNASRELAKIGKPAVPPLLEAAKSKNPNARWWALSSLAGIGDPVAIDTFLACLRDPNQTVRCVAVYQSRRFITDERIRAALLAMTPQADAETRKWLLRTFVEGKFAPAIPVLREGLKNPDPQTRADFLDALTKLDKAGSFDDVKRVLATDPDERCRASAVICLENLLPPALPRITIVLIRAYPFVFWFGEREPPPRRFVAVLISALDDKSVKVQGAAVLRLYRLTNQKFLFSPKSSAEERAQAIKQWKDWWAKTAATFPD